jgi:protein TonB
MGVVAAAHAALVFVIANGFGLVPKEKKTEPMVGTFIDQPQVIDEDRRPTVGPPDFATQQAFVPAPDNPQYEADTPGAISVALRPADEIEIGPGRVIPEPVPEMGVRADPKHPLTRPRYPDEMIRGEVEGAVVVEVFVQTNGRIGDARIVTSSGYDAFDRATLAEARRNWRMLPATRNGEPFAQWFRTRVVFKLTDR